MSPPSLENIFTKCTPLTKNMQEKFAKIFDIQHLKRLSASCETLTYPYAPNPILGPPKFPPAKSVMDVVSAMPSGVQYGRLSEPSQATKSQENVTVHILVSLSGNKTTCKRRP